MRCVCYMNIHDIHSLVSLFVQNLNKNEPVFQTKETTPFTVYLINKLPSNESTLTRISLFNQTKW